MRSLVASLSPAIAWAPRWILLGALAIFAAAPGCTCSSLFRARLGNPTIGTRTTANGDLTQTSKVDSARLIGCDIQYWNIPSGTTLRVVWNFYTDDRDATPQEQSRGNAMAISGTGMLTTEVPIKADFPAGIYECKWKLASDKAVDNAEPSARISVGR